MTLDELFDLSDYWAKHPPLHLLFQMFVQGFAEEKPSVPGLPGRSHSSAEDVLATLGAGAVDGG